MKVQFWKETKFFNIFKFSSERGREGERNTRLNQDPLVVIHSYLLHNHNCLSITNIHMFLNPFQCIFFRSRCRSSAKWTQLIITHHVTGIKWSTIPLFLSPSTLRTCFLPTKRIKVCAVVVIHLLLFVCCPILLSHRTLMQDNFLRNVVPVSPLSSFICNSLASALQMGEGSTGILWRGPITAAENWSLSTFVGRCRRCCRCVHAFTLGQKADQSRGGYFNLDAKGLICDLWFVFTPWSRYS